MIEPQLDRVFLDANVLFSAAYLQGSGLARLWKRGGPLLLTSAFAIEEARRNLAPGAPRERLDVLLRKVTVVPEAPWTGGAASSGLPEKDIPILAAAIRARATHLMTGDLNHFDHLMQKTVDGVLVLRPAQYLQD